MFYILAQNAKGSWDLNNNDPDPMPEVHKDDGKSLNRHGTRCAGEIAAVANDKCAVGVAFNAQISGESVVLLIAVVTVTLGYLQSD